LCSELAHDGIEGDEQAQSTRAIANIPPLIAKRTIFPSVAEPMCP
jgi:hypothetical protein